jgi:hypothetical protein
MTLQVVSLPNDTFMLVVSGEIDRDDVDQFKDLKEHIGACAVLVIDGEVEVRTS